jgi:hypothetical protein
MIIIYIISKNNNSGGGGRFDDDDDVIITKRGENLSWRFFPFQQVVDLEAEEVLVEVLVASEVAEVSAEVALLADGRKR